MRILYYELRKIWRPSILLILTVLGMMYYFLFMEFDIRYFPNGHPAAEKYAFAREWTDKYGTSMEPDEYLDAKRAYAELVAGADAQIAADPRFQAHGITAWEQLCELRQDHDAYVKYQDISELLMSEEYGFLAYRIEGLNSMLNAYEFRLLRTERGFIPQTAAERARLFELKQEPIASGIFPSECVDNLSEYMVWAGIFAVVSVCILLGACGARENLCQTSDVLWTTQLGRGICRYRFAAVLLSAAGLFLLELLIFGGIYAQLGTGYFWDSPTQTFLYGDFFLMDLSYGQYVLCLLAMTLSLMLGTAGAVFALSSASANYISAILKTLPLAVVLVFAAAAVMGHPFTTENEMYRHLHIIGVERMLCGVLLLAGLAAGLTYLRYTHRKELM